MPFESIIITGTSCAGKTTIAQKLCDIHKGNNQRFKIVQAVTTRTKRQDDINYEYICDKMFDRLKEQGSLLVSTTYRGKKYGIIKTKYANILNENQIPVLILSPDAAKSVLSRWGEEKFMCFFLDAPDTVLLERLEKRTRKEIDTKDKSRFIEQNQTDRTFQNAAHYSVQNIDITATASLIESLWAYRHQSGALSQKIIKNFINCGLLLRNADPEMIKGASYDLCLGDEYYYAGEVRKLSDAKPFLTIEPYDYAIVSCKEMAWLPRDVIAKFGLSVGLFCQGVILSNGPQIDPGFHGTLFCLLFNTSNRTVHLKRGQHYATIEFVKTIGYADSYEGKYQGKRSIIDYIPANTLYGAINELKKEVEQLKNESRIMQNIYLGVVALMFAIVSILLVID